MSAFDVEAIRQWFTCLPTDGGKVDVVVPAAIWAQMLSDLAACCDEIEKWQEGAA